MISRSKTKYAAAVLAAALLAASCGATDTSSEQATPDSSTATGEQPGPTVGEASADAVLVDLSHGGQLDWNTLPGKDVMLWFWAPW